MNLDYKITTTAELAGAEAAADALERQIGKVKALKQDSSALDAQLKTMRASIDEAGSSMRRAGNTSQSLAEAQMAAQEALAGYDRAALSATARMQSLNPALEKHGNILGSDRMRAELFRRSLLSLGLYIPGLEYAVYGLGTSLGALTLGVIGGSIALEKFIKFLRDAYAPMEQISSSPTFLDGINARADALNSGAEAADAYAQKLDDIIDRENSVATALTSQLDLLQKIDEARASASSASDSLAEARVKARIATGELTPSGGRSALAEIKIAAEARKNEEEYQAAQTVIADKKKTLGSLDVPGETARAEAMASQVTAEDAHRKQTDADYKKLFGDDPNKAINDADSAVEAAKEKLLKAKTTNAWGLPGLPVQENIDKAQLVLEQAKTNQSKLNSMMQQHQADVASGPAFDQFKTDTDRAKQKADEDAQLLATLTTEIKRLTDALTSTQGLKDQASLDNQKTALYDVYAGDINEAQKDLATINEISGNAKQISGNAKQISADAAKLAAKHKDALDAINDAMSAISTLSGFGEDIAKLKQQVAQLKYAADHH